VGVLVEHQVGCVKVSELLLGVFANLIVRPQRGKPLTGA
jgi:hypothetical protein